jgi:hypothetical protein
VLPNTQVTGDGHLQTTLIGASTVARIDNAVTWEALAAIKAGRMGVPVNLLNQI